MDPSIPTENNREGRKRKKREDTQRAERAKGKTKKCRDGQYSVFAIKKKKTAIAWLVAEFWEEEEMYVRGKKRGSTTNRKKKKKLNLQ